MEVENGEAERGRSTGANLDLQGPHLWLAAAPATTLLSWQDFFLNSFFFV